MRSVSVAHVYERHAEMVSLHIDTCQWCPLPSIAMGVQASNENATRVLRQEIPSHPLAVPSVPGSWGERQVRRVRDAPLGYVRTR